jgi:hypothetical protein
MKKFKCIHSNVRIAGTLSAPPSQGSRPRPSAPQPPPTHLHPSRRGPPYPTSHLQRLSPPPPPPPATAPVPAPLPPSHQQQLPRKTEVPAASKPELLKRYRPPPAAGSRPSLQKLRMEDESGAERFSAEPPQVPPRPIIFPKSRSDGQVPKIATLQMIQQRGALDEDIIRSNLPPLFKINRADETKEDGADKEESTLSVSLFHPLCLLSITPTPPRHSKAFSPIFLSRYLKSSPRLVYYLKFRLFLNAYSSLPPYLEKLLCFLKSRLNVLEVPLFYLKSCIYHSPLFRFLFISANAHPLSIT